MKPEPLLNSVSFNKVYFILKLLLLLIQFRFSLSMIVLVIKVAEAMNTKIADTLMSKIARRQHIQVLALVLFIFTSIWVAMAQDSWAGGHVLTSFSSTPMNSGELSEKEAVDKALAAFSGDVLSVKAQDASGQPVFRIQILSSSGRVKVLNINRRNGEVVH